MKTRDTKEKTATDASGEASEKDANKAVVFFGTFGITLFPLILASGLLVWGKLNPDAYNRHVATVNYLFTTGTLFLSAITVLCITLLSIYVHGMRKDIPYWDKIVIQVVCVFLAPMGLLLGSALYLSDQIMSMRQTIALTVATFVIILFTWRVMVTLSD